jgi:hypothetical protein
MVHVRRLGGRCGTFAGPLACLYNTTSTKSEARGFVKTHKYGFAVLLTPCPISMLHTEPRSHLLQAVYLGGRHSHIMYSLHWALCSAEAASSSRKLGRRGRASSTRALPAET